MSNEWISVRTTRPPDMRPVLIHVDNEGDHEMYVALYNGIMWYDGQGAFSRSVTVTHWMPLPEPPHEPPPQA